jgi:carbohydrate-selective porin OprB
MFSPSKDNTGLGMRIMTQFLQWSSDQSDDPRFRIKAGWINPYEDFFRQPEDWFFENNALSGFKGISAVSPGQGAIYGHNSNGAPLYNTVAPIPWSSSYAAWGGELRVKPSSSTYVVTALATAQAGFNGTQTFVTTPVNVYPYTPVAPQNVGQLKSGQYTYTTVNPNGTPRPGSSTGKVTPYNNHGFNFQGSCPYQGGYTGLYNVNEIGWTPKFGSDGLKGKYALGAILYGQSYTRLSGPYRNIDGKNYAVNQCNVAWDLYFQADQRLTAVHESSRPSESLSKNPSAPSKKISDPTRGLYFSSSLVVAPDYQSTLPFYFQAGFTFHGPMDARPKDTVGIALGCGFYSSTYNSYINNVLNGPGSYASAGYKPMPYFTSTQVLETFYNIQINNWLQFRPDAQFIINPFGNGTVGNDLVIGAELMAKF